MKFIHFPIKKIIVTFALFCSLTIVSHASVITGCFPDTSGHQYENAICYAKDTLGLINGYPDGTFQPDKSINRAEFTKIFIGYLFGHETTGQDCFSDVHEEWFAKYVCEAKNLGAIDGYADGTFKPNNTINLAETLKIIYELSDKELIDNNKNEWYAKYLDTALNDGLLDNIGYEPGKLMTRAEMAEIFYQMEEGCDADCFDESLGGEIMYPCEEFGPCSYESESEVVDANGDLWYFDEDLLEWILDENFQHQGDTGIFYPCDDFGPCQLEEENHVIDAEGRNYYWNNDTFEWELEDGVAAG